METIKVIFVDTVNNVIYIDMLLYVYKYAPLYLLTSGKMNKQLFINQKKKIYMPLEI